MPTFLPNLRLMRPLSFDCITCISVCTVYNLFFNKVYMCEASSKQYQDLQTITKSGPRSPLLKFPDPPLVVFGSTISIPAPIDFFYQENFRFLHIQTIWIFEIPLWYLSAKSDFLLISMLTNVENAKRIQEIRMTNRE